MAQFDDHVDGAQPGVSQHDEADAVTHAEKRERGATLLFALAILALLVLFSTVFARLMSLERRASAYYTDRVRAKLAARAGIERAIVELRAVAGQRHYSDPYGGKWAFYRVPPKFPTAGDPINLLNTVYPSFFQVDDPDLDGNPSDARSRFGTPITYSGYLGQPYDDSLLVYRLKILDAGSQLNLNHPDTYAANRMLKNLLRATAQLEGGSDPAVPFVLTPAQAQSIANTLIPLPTGTPLPTGERYGRFRSKPQIGEAFTEAMTAVLGDPTALPTALNPSKSADLYDEIWNRHLRDKVTVYSWEDPDVIRPWALNRADGQQANVRKNLSLMPRAPINLNTASQPVLTALFAELAAETRLGSVSISYTMAQQLALRIATRRGEVKPTNGNDPRAPNYTGTYRPFRSWTEFEQWLDGVGSLDNGSPDPDSPNNNAVFTANCPGSLTAGAPLAKVDWKDVTNTSMDWAPAGGLIARLQTEYRILHHDLIKAMLNPNTMVNKFGLMPNHGGFRRRYQRTVDKTDIVRMTTEGCFDSLGVFEITSTGLILLRDPRDPNVGYEVHAGHTDLEVVRVYNPFRITTQRQFEEHRALMVEGNIIVTPESLPLSDPDPAKRVAGRTYVDHTGAAGGTVSEAIAVSTNSAAYFPQTAGDPNQPDTPYRNPAWPGMVTWPQYSLKRVDTMWTGAASSTMKFPMPEAYASSTWDGHMTLTNMITVRTSDYDFLCGFARGKLDAFKCRAWWEPKDMEASGAFRATGPGGQKLPTRPTWKDSPGLDFVASPSKEMRYLATPLTAKTHAPKLQAAGLVTVLNEEFTDPGVNPTNPPGMFAEGSSLVNTGVIIGPDRPAETNPNQPAFIAFDSNNIDLVRGTSIRFWVQPLRDPYAQDDETLFYFKGSNGSDDGTSPSDGSAAHGSANWRPNPPGSDANLSGWPCPQRSGSDAPETNPRKGVRQEAGFRVSKQVNALTGKVEIVLEDLGASQQNRRWGQTSQTSVDVTPSIMLSASGTSTELKKPDPSKPEWIPGSWHWVVINIGPVNLGTGGGKRQSTASLQVDKATLSTGANNGAIEFCGNNYTVGSAVNTAKHAWGCEVLAVKEAYPGSSIDDFVDVVTTSSSGSIRFNLVPRQLGDFYHCTQYDSASKAGSLAVNGAAPVGGNGALAYRRTVTYPGPVIQYSGGPWWWYRFTPGGVPGWYVKTGGWPATPFPKLVTNRNMALPFPGGSVPVPFTNGGWTPQFPQQKVPPPSPFGPAGDDYGSAPTPAGVSGPALEEWPYPGGNAEWTFSLAVSWDEVHYMGRSPWAANRWPSGPYHGSAPWLPADLSLLDMVDHPPGSPITKDASYEPNGGRLPYACDNSGLHVKNGATTTKANDMLTTMPDLAYPAKGMQSFIRTRTGLSVNGLTIPMDAVDDDCHGCEDCDIDGPVFIGAQPSGTQNYKGNGEIADADLSRVATAVFDNIVFINGLGPNGTDRRTDSVDANPANGAQNELLSGGQVSLAAKPFEDRFYEEDLASFLRDGLGQQPGTGAVYHRGLLELRNRQFRLASMTWTSYPTRVTGLDFEVALWKIEDLDPASPSDPNFRYANTNLLKSGNPVVNGDRDRPMFGAPGGGGGPGTLPVNQIYYARDAKVGLVFGKDNFAQRKIDFLTDFFLSDESVINSGFGATNLYRSPYVDGLGDPPNGVPPELLILGVRLRNYNQPVPKNSTDPGTTEDDPNSPDSGVLVSPVLETPVFEDVTLNLTYTRPQILYAEEGAIE